MSRKDRYKKKMKAKGQEHMPNSMIQFNAPQRTYVITNQAIVPPWLQGKPAEVDVAIKRLHDLSQSSPSQAIPELLDSIERWPDVPNFRNFLVMAYNGIGNYVKSNLETIELYQLFPNYLFAKANYVAMLLRADQIDKAAKILDGRFTIGEHYPERSEFHVTELAAFNYAVGLYLAILGRHAEARKVYLELFCVAPNNDLTQALREAMDEMHSFDDVEVGWGKAKDPNNPGRLAFTKKLIATVLESFRSAGSWK